MPISTKTSGSPRRASKKLLPCLILATKTKTPMPTNAEKTGWVKGVLISLNKPKPPGVLPVTAKTRFSIIANPKPVVAPIAAPYLRFGKTRTRANATTNMHTPFEISSVRNGAMNIGVAQLAASPKAEENALFTAKGKAMPSMLPSTNAIRNAIGISKSLLNLVVCSNSASFALIWRKKLVGGR